MVQSILNSNEKLRKYNRDYYLKNKERLLIYNKIYKTIQRERNLESLQNYYDNISNVEKNWSKAMPKVKSTRVRFKKLRYDKGPKVMGFSRSLKLVEITFD